MIRYFFKTIQGRIIGLFVVFMTLVFAISFYTIRYTSQNALEKEKERKLLYVAIYQDRLLGELDYDAILAEAGASGAPRDEQISALCLALAERTDDIAALFPGLGVGYYCRELDAIVTYGPSNEYGDRVGVAIAPDHPGRTAMAENRDIVQQGSMVRGNIMNAMHPIVRGGEVIGYAWANELVSDIEQEYRTLSDNISVVLAVFYAASLLAAIMLSRRMIRDIDTIVTGVKNMRVNLATRIKKVSGELSEVADNINRMAEDLENNAEEHDALLRAEAANAAQREFLSRMSHEMRTPMNAVIGLTALARRTDDPKKIQDHLDKINGAAKHLLGVINDVLDMSKIEAGKFELSETSFSFHTMLHHVVAVSSFKTDEKHQNFSLTIGEGVPEYVIADRQRLVQVITNLLSNANKFTPDGGNILLSARLIASGGGECCLQIAVRDDGIGISEEQQARLFRSFEQVDNSISRKYGGTGLGLAISKRIVELMRGRIWIESVLGEGSSFIFEITVPVGDGEEADAAPHPAASANPSLAAAPESVNGMFAGRRILLAEDIKINREIVTALLEPTGADIDCAENGAEAVRLFNEAPSRYDLIFMDVQMPEMDGYEATRRIRRMDAANAKTIPIIAMTANVFRDDIEKCLVAGMNGHVGKPLDFGEVVEKLRGWLGEKPSP